MVLNGQDGSKESSRGQEECIRFGPVLPQTTEIDCGDLEKVGPSACARPRCTEEKVAGKDEEAKIKEEMWLLWGDRS